MSNKKVNLEGKISLDEVLSKFKDKNTEFIKNIEREEEYENSIETVDSIKNDIKGLKTQTNLKKQNFINELKTGLGDKVKSNPNKVTIVKKKWYVRFGLMIKKLFTKF